jgi:membrane protein YdbS with pleckstrin-like domain
MSDNIDFKDLWSKQTSNAPGLENVISEITKMKQANLKKLVVTNILLLSTSIFIVLIWLYYQPQLITTKMGIIIIILAMVIYLAAYNKSFSLYKSQMNAQSNSDYIKDLLAIKARQVFMEKTMLNVYFILLSTGIGLYMYEYTSRMKPIWGCVTYGITAIWILYNWFYVRPKKIRHQKEKLDTIISRFKMVNQQLKG